MGSKKAVAKAQRLVDDGSFTVFNRNPELVLARLKEAGFVVQDGFAYRIKDEEKREIWPTRYTIAAAMRNAFNRVGRKG